jgi:hypothetical protein
MATLTAQKITDVGIAETLVAATAGGDEFINSGVEVVHIQNDSGVSLNVTITAQVTHIHHQQFGTVTKSNIVKAVAADESAFIGPFKQSAFNDANQKVQITYSGVGSLKVSVLYLDQQ